MEKKGVRENIPQLAGWKMVYVCDEIKNVRADNSGSS